MEILAPPDFDAYWRCFLSFSSSEQQRSFIGNTLPDFLVTGNIGVLAECTLDSFVICIYCLLFSGPKSELVKRRLKSCWYLGCSECSSSAPRSFSTSCGKHGVPHSDGQMWNLRAFMWMWKEAVWICTLIVIILHGKWERWNSETWLSSSLQWNQT